MDGIGHVDFLAGIDVVGILDMGVHGLKEFQSLIVGEIAVTAAEALGDQLGNRIPPF